MVKSNIIRVHSHTEMATSAKDAGCIVAGVLTTHTREELPHADHHLEHLNQLLGKAGL